MLNGVEGEIRGWAISKFVLAARRLRRDGTRGIRLGEVIEIHDSLINGTYGTALRDLSRESHTVARANHTLGRDRNLWSNVLSAEPPASDRLDASASDEINLPGGSRIDCGITKLASTSPDGLHDFV